MFPILFFPFIVLISIMNSSFIGHPFNFSLMNFLFGYASVIYVLIGIYFGRIFPIHLIKKGLDIFIVLAILSILIAWGQFLSEEFTEITKYIYNPFNYNNFNQHWHIRPPGPFVRVFSYAFFTVSLFWLIIFYPNSEIKKSVKRILIIFIILSLLISGTRSGVLAIILDL